MIPSRGLQWSSQTIGIGRRRIGTLPSRQFSSSSVQHRQIRANPLLSTTNSFSKVLPQRQPLVSTIIRNAGSIRFASTNSVLTPAPPAPPPSFVPDSFSDLDFKTISEIPEHIGYLKSLGLDYGFGPTAGVEWVLEHTHVLLGTPWWISIAATALIFRLIMLKPYLWAAENATRMATVKPITEPLTVKMKAATVAGDTDRVMEFRRDIQLIHKRAGIKIWKGFAPLIQIFTGYGTFVLLRAMSKLPVPGLENGGILWFYNLALPDPYFIIPMATAAVTHWLLRQGGETGVSTISPEAQRALSYGLPVLTLLFTWWLPAACQLSFFVSSVCSFIQSTVLRNLSFRSWLGMTPPPPRPGSGPSSPYKGTLNIAASTPTYQAARPSKPSSSSSSSSHPNPKFQATNFADEEVAAPPAPPVSRAKSMFQKITKPMGDVADTGRAMVAKANTNMDQRRARGENEERQRYELKRQEEIKKERWERQNRARAERAARRNENL